MVKLGTELTTYNHKGDSIDVSRRDKALFELLKDIAFRLKHG